ncbi:MAG: hypothetical protein ACXU95_04835 [Isosphaeraceae bacterium]
MKVSTEAAIIRAKIAFALAAVELTRSGPADEAPLRKAALSMLRNYFGGADAANIIKKAE